MKFVHCADIHLGSKIAAKLPPEKTEERKAEVRAAFKNMVEKAAGYGAKVIVLAGDVFDSDRPLKKDKEFFYSVVKNNPDIDFLYLRGNHDNLESYSEDLDNLKTFTNEWSGYSYGNVVFYGLETAAENYSSMYSSLKLDPAKINIVILHGQKSDSVGKDKINIAKLKNKNIDYLALGHIHSVNFGRIDERGVYAYPGCLEGRGFDETGAKGFILVDTEGGKINAGFVENSVRKTDEFTVDISAANDVYEAYRIVKSNINAQKSDLLRIVLKGEISFDGEGLKGEIERLLSGEYYFVSVKDDTLRKFDAEKIAGDNSLKGEFIRLVLADETIDGEKKQKVISVGLKALSDRELDI